VFVDSVDSTGLTSSLTKALDALERLDQDGPSPAASVRGKGSSADGQVRAEVSAFGRLEELKIDPMLSRAGATAIADHVLAAVQAAQDDAQRQASELLGAAAGPVDTSAMSAELNQVAADATRGFDRMITDLDAVLRRLDRL
jgi:DNA-binding protein YbaB